MTAWEVCHYSFPDDDGETLERVLDDLPPVTLNEFVGSVAEYSVLRASQMDALVVLLMMRGKGVGQIEEGLLYVPDHVRQECRAAMSQGLFAAEDWQRLWEIGFGTAGSKVAFEALSPKHGFSRQI